MTIESPQPARNPLTVLSRKALAKNSLLNLVGFAVPLLVGLLTIPLVIRGFGVERFGLLALGWAIVGYFSLFDLGMGRAITQLVAERLDKLPERDIAKLAWTGLLAMTVFAVIGAVIIGALTPWVVSSVLKMPEVLRGEATQAFIILTAAIPAVVLSAGFSGLLAAIQRFDLVNILRIPTGIMIFLIPLAVLPFSSSVVYVCAGLLIVRIFSLVLHIMVCLRAFPMLRTHVGVSRREIRTLLSFGGWITVTNIVGPFMMYLDRFVIGVALSVSAVAYYVTPYEIVSRLWAIPVAVVAGLFPAFAAAKQKDLKQAATLFSMGGRAVLVILAPIVLLLIVFAEEGFRLWLGDDFAQESTAVLQWLAIGVYLNSYAQVPFSLVQGVGRADITAKLHLLELPIYIFLMYSLLDRFGIVGVAIAWVVRIVLDTALLTLVAHRLVKGVAAASRQIFPVLVAPLILFVIGMTLHGVIAKALFTGFAFLAFIALGYFFAITLEERRVIRRAAQRVLGI